MRSCPTQLGDESEAAAAKPKRAPKKKMKLTHAKYNKITHLIKHRLRESDTKQVGIRQQDLVNWYLEHQQKEGKLGEDWTMEGEGSEDKDATEMLKMERTMVTLVIKRLYTKDRVLLCVREPDGAKGENQGDRLLVVHPQHE